MKLDEFIDHMVDDTVREWMRERDFEPAYWRNECLPQYLNLPVASCVRLQRKQQTVQQLQRRPPSTPAQRRQLWWLGRQIMYLRGQCAEQRLTRGLCVGQVAPGVGRPGGFDVRNQVRVFPSRPRSPVVDISPFPQARPGRRAPPVGYESKYMHLPHYVDPVSGAVDAQRLRQQVHLHVAQVLQQMRASSARGARDGLPPRIELVYQIGAASPGQLRAVSGIVRGVTGPAGVRAHVIAAL